MLQRKKHCSHETLGTRRLAIPAPSQLLAGGLPPSQHAGPASAISRFRKWQESVNDGPKAVTKTPHPATVSSAECGLHTFGDQLREGERRRSGRRRGIA